jgi:hypothetical protein
MPPNRTGIWKDEQQPAPPFYCPSEKNIDVDLPRNAFVIFCRHLCVRKEFAAIVSGAWLATASTMHPRWLMQPLASLGERPVPTWLWKTAHVALLADSLSDLSFAIGFSRATNRLNRGRCS